MYNHFIVVGRLAKDPELFKSADDKKAMSNFTVAVERPGSDKASYVNVKAFDKNAENLVTYKKKGDMILVEGFINQNSYQKENRTVYTQDLVASRIQYLSNARSTQNEAYNEIGSEEAAIIDEEPELERGM